MYNTQEKIFIILFLLQKFTIIYVISLATWKGLKSFARITYKIHKKNYKKQEKIKKKKRKKIKE